MSGIENAFGSPVTGKSHVKAIGSEFLYPQVLENLNKLIKNYNGDDELTIDNLFPVAPVKAADPAVAAPVAAPVVEVVTADATPKKIKKPAEKKYFSTDHNVNVGLTWLIWRCVFETHGLTINTETPRSEICEKATQNNEFNITTFIFHTVDAFKHGPIHEQIYYKFDGWLNDRLSVKNAPVIADEKLRRIIVQQIAAFVKIVGFNMANALYSVRKQKVVNMNSFITILRNLNELTDQTLDEQVIDEMIAYVKLYNVKKEKTDAEKAAAAVPAPAVAAVAAAPAETPAVEKPAPKPRGRKAAVKA